MPLYVAAQKILNSAALLDTGSFTTTITQVIEAGTANPAKGDNLYLLNTRRVKGKGFFYPYSAMGNLANSKGGIQLSPLLFQDKALENLDPLLGALNNTDMHLDGISRAKVRMVKAHLLLINLINNIHSHVMCFYG